MAAYVLNFYNNNTNVLYVVPYIANTGIPTLLLFYNNSDTLGKAAEG